MNFLLVEGSEPGMEARRSEQRTIGHGDGPKNLRR
jgi:hypothetical protein